MGVLLFAVVWIVSAVIGALGWPQIIGSLRKRQRGFLFPVLLWAAILIGEFFLVRGVLPEEIYAYFIGTGITLIITLCTKKIE